MKRLFGLLLVFVVFFSFSIQSGHAQATGVSKADLERKGNTLFTNFVNQLQVKQNNPKGTIPSLASASDAEVARYVQGNKDLIAVINEGKSTFATLLASPAAPSSNIYADFTAALNGASTRINTGQRTTATITNNPLLRAEVSVISYQINTLAQERQQTLINSGQGDAAVAIQGQVATQRAAQKEPDPQECFSFTQFNMGTCISEFVQWFIKNTLMQIAGFLLWITSNMFSHVVQVGILDFKQWASDALYPIWALVRQIVSLGVVFVGLYLGFMYILGREDKFARYIPWVLMFALFVNFSYPIARFAVDISNVVSLNIYAAAFSNEALNNNSSASAGAVIMNRLGLADLVMSATYVEGGQTANIIKGINSVPAALLVVVFILYAAYVFFIATAILAIRTAALVFLTVASPFLFIDSVLPLMGDKAQQIRKIFFEQLAVGPIFMLLIGLTTKFLLVFSEGPLKAQVDSSIAGDSAGIAVFFNILMMIIMLHITLKVTKSVAGTIGQYATDAMGKVGGFAMGAATGGAGLLARNSLGRLAAKARDSKWVTNNQNSVIGRRMYDMSNSFAKSSFDLRNSSVIAGGMQKAGMGMGTGRTAGYEEAMEARRKDILERGSRIKTRYERDVTDKDGNVIHRKGDIDKEADAAYDKYVAESGGSVFMSREQKQLAREALGKQKEEMDDKAIAEAKKNAEREVGLYNAAEDTVDPRTGKLTTKAENQKNFVAELRKELEQLSERGVDLQRDTQAQSIIGALNTIEKSREREAIAENKKITDLLEKFERMQGLDPQDKNGQQAKFLANMDKDTYAAFKAAQANSGGAIILGADGKPMPKPASGSAALDIDLNGPPTVKTVADTNWDNYELPPSMRGTSTSSVNPADAATARALKQQEAAARANAEMDRNTRSTSAPAVDIPIDIPETHNPATDDVAAIATQLALSNMKKGPPPYDPASSSTSPRTPTPSSGGSSAASDKNRREIAGAFAEARGKPSEVARIAKEAEKMGFDSESISRMRDEAATA